MNIIDTIANLISEDISFRAGINEAKLVHPEVDEFNQNQSNHDYYSYFIKITNRFNNPVHSALFAIKAAILANTPLSTATHGARIAIDLLRQCVQDPSIMTPEQVAPTVRNIMGTDDRNVAIRHAIFAIYGISSGNSSNIAIDAAMAAMRAVISKGEEIIPQLISYAKSLLPKQKGKDEYQFNKSGIQTDAAQQLQRIVNTPEEEITNSDIELIYYLLRDDYEIEGLDEEFNFDKDDPNSVYNDILEMRRLLRTIQKEFNSE